jgi:hypothetical protein
MTITGLDNNYYLINNQINLLINGFASDVRYLEISVYNTNTTKPAKVRLYPINNTFKVDISHLVKSTFNDPLYPNVNINLNTIAIDFKVVFLDETVLSQKQTKQFIRGGNWQGVYPDCETQKQNYLFDVDVLDFLITKKVAAWGEEPKEVYEINGTQYASFLEPALTENFEIPCKGIKTIFLNQYGTYSEWYFNNYEINSNTKHTDFIEKFSTDFNGNLFNDLGSKVDTTITVKDSVPLRFNQLIRHLIVSPEIYVVEDGFNRKVILNNSKWVYSTREKSYKHSITFDYLTVINPSDLC